MIEWLLQYKQVFIVMAWFSMALLLISIMVIPWLINSLPSDYFKHTNRHTKESSYHPILRNILIAIKNIIGLIFIKSFQKWSSGSKTTREREKPKKELMLL